MSYFSSIYAVSKMRKNCRIYNALTEAATVRLTATTQGDQIAPTLFNNVPPLGVSNYSTLGLSRYS